MRDPDRSGERRDILNSYRYGVLACILFFSLVSCGTAQRHIKQVAEKLASQTVNFFYPSKRRTRHASPEKCFFLQGTVSGDTSNLVFPLAVVAVAPHASTSELVDTYILESPGYFGLYVPEGEYEIALLSDMDGDRVYEQDEIIGAYERPLVLKSDEKTFHEGVVTGIDLEAGKEIPLPEAGRFSLRVPEKLPVMKEGSFPSGTVSSLDNPLFERKYAILGLYNPAAFLERVPFFFYSLEEYDPLKIPVVFVHGAGGTPRDWEYIIENMDREHFQAWFFYYPSGESISKLSELFYRIVLQKGAVKEDISSMVITAHSMGGLIVREALNRFQDRNSGRHVKAFISFSTPFGGSDWATTGTKGAPVMMPSWRDLATGSAFLKNLYRKDMPACIKHYLFFAYHNEKFFNTNGSSDGTVSLRSQLYPAAQFSALKLYGYDETHSTILASEEAVKEYIEILDTVYMNDELSRGPL